MSGLGRRKKTCVSVNVSVSATECRFLCSPLLNVDSSDCHCVPLIAYCGPLMPTDDL